MAALEQETGTDKGPSPSVNSASTDAAVRKLDAQEVGVTPVASAVGGGSTANEAVSSSPGRRSTSIVPASSPAPSSSAPATAPLSPSKNGAPQTSVTAAPTATVSNTSNARKSSAPASAAAAAPVSGAAASDANTLVADRVKTVTTPRRRDVPAKSNLSAKSGSTRERDRKRGDNVATTPGAGVVEEGTKRALRSGTARVGVRKEAEAARAADKSAVKNKDGEDGEDEAEDDEEDELDVEHTIVDDGEEDDGGSGVGQDEGEEVDELQEMTVADARIEGQFISRMIASYLGLGGRTGPRLSDQDWLTAAELVGAWMAIEGNMGFIVSCLFIRDSQSESNACAQIHGRDVPMHTIDSLHYWAGRRERPAVLDNPEDVEEDYGDRVVHFWLAIRSLPAGEVLEMVGQNGLSTFVQAAMQWRPVEPDTDDWVLVIQDVVTGLRALRVADDDELSEPLSLLISRANARAAASAVALMEERASTVTGPSGWTLPRAAPPRRSTTAKAVKQEVRTGAGSKARNTRTSRKPSAAPSGSKDKAPSGKKRRREDDSDDDAAAAGPSRASEPRPRGSRPRKSGRF